MKSGTVLKDAQWVSELTGFAPNVVLRMAHRGEIPAVRVGRYVRFRADEIEQYLATLPSAAT